MKNIILWRAHPFVSAKLVNCKHRIDYLPGKHSIHFKLYPRIIKLSYPPPLVMHVQIPISGTTSKQPQADTTALIASKKKNREPQFMDESHQPRRVFTVPITQAALAHPRLPLTRNIAKGIKVVVFRRKDDIRRNGRVECVVDHIA